MGLLSIFKRQADAQSDAGTSTAPDAVAAARGQARRRLIGAALLLGLGIVGFPLLFETQPRPVAHNIPIEVPGKDSGHPASPAKPLAPATGAVAVDAPAEPVAPAEEAEVVESRPEAGAKPAAAVVASSEPSAALVPRAAASASRPVASAGKAAPPAVPAAKPPGTADEAARARALLNDDSASAPKQRVVVQVGAFSDADKLREARQKVEKLGFKTYTQVVEADGAKRTRVRVGPFATRAEADRAAERLKSAGLAAAIYTL